VTVLGISEFKGINSKVVLSFQLAIAQWQAEPDRSWWR